MTTELMIGVLLLLSGYLGARLLTASKEITALRAHVAALKRQLQRR